MPAQDQAMFKLIFFVPSTHTEAVKEAVFATEAGKYGNYECCSFQVRGQGQFRPLQGANPHIGKVMQLEKVEEDMVEVLVSADKCDAAIAALKRAHPYETPAWQLIQLHRPLSNELSG
eukprot:Gregarina_sp_Pseudo_9__2349@NODE_265_length_3358_cov_208_164206_g248_i0_p5_GENE_NODE_265_length_3358_cov_208_164206_g248_i0NODE_265_length_3358_cov_208_164206_g248_i0_p5_ORF_typecomplete_len118_score22_60PII/PF00543_22/0_00074CutA1/PF03091_15/1_6e03CutA1/PF03091_15/0_012_NODE_265_length_3358_cov_208_164206_g248_i017002053